MLIVGGIGLLLVMLLGLLQSCSSIFGGGVSNIVASSYLSEDADMLAAEAAYCELEQELQYSWTTMRLCTPDMTNTVLIWTRSSMTLMC